MKNRKLSSLLSIALAFNLVLINACSVSVLSKEPKKEADAGWSLAKFGLGQPQDAHFDSFKKPYKLTAEETLNLDILTPQSDWNKVYSIGRAAYMDGDFRRAYNAFDLAMIKAKAQGITDARLTETEQAFKSVQGRASDLDVRLGFKLAADKKPRIEKVFPGSLAWLAGVKAGDRIAFMKEKDNVTKLSVMRTGKTFSFTITDRAKRDIPNFNALLSLTPHGGTPTLAGGTTQETTDLTILKQNESLLANHDLILIIDKSGSMTDPFGPSGLSQWQWCQEQTQDLYSVQQYFPRGIRLVLFDDRYQVFDRKTVNDISTIYQTVVPYGGTNLALPFWNTLSAYFSHRPARPMIIAIISDFETAGEQVREGVLEAAKRVGSPDQLRICLLEVGTGGRRLVDALDNDMTSVGAPFDIVDATYSDELLRIGLKNALVAALLKNKNAALGARRK